MLCDDGFMSYVLVCFELYLVIDVCNMELIVIYYLLVYVGGCYVCIFGFLYLFWLCLLEGRRQ